MKFKLTNYDASDYKLLEYKLNNLSKLGYNCNSVDIFTIFKYDNKHFYYKTDIFVPDKKSKLSNHEQRDNWLMNYIDHGYKFIGKSKKIYIFKAEKNIKVKETDNSLLLKYFKTNKTLTNILLVFTALFLSFLLIPNVFINNSPNEFITNGSILLHYAPLVFCLSLIVRFINNYMQTEKIKNTLTKQTRPKINNIQEYSFILSNWLFIISILVIISGFSLDTIERKTIPINDNILSLNDLGYTSDRSETYTKSSSLLINEFYSYFENNDDEALKINYYRFDSHKKANKNLDNYLKTNNYKKKKQIASGYLLSNDSNYDSIIFVKNDQLIIVQTTLNLLKDDTYQKILNFNY
ncbi:DUF2812 domain-containing protein [Thomasclavelia cocleata]|uniref:DUF2812 domain-containing protein n=1 Tax=Thomasclavelia cocleata TaxID=69824 RepID=UPI00242D674A|nr:DUF2812 domain-containing protein [Thomasclavelia cocleata]